jgi:hypothetical protein
LRELGRPCDLESSILVFVVVAVVSVVETEDENEYRDREGTIVETKKDLKFICIIVSKSYFAYHSS